MKVRLDQHVHISGLAESVDRAQRLIMAGQVRVDGRVVSKVGTLIDPAADVAVQPSRRYVSRGADKRRDHAYPQDIAPTAAVAFTINHIAAVGLPAVLGYLWVTSPGAVFGLAAAMAVASLGLALLIPRHPAPGRETVLSRGLPAPAE